MIAQRSDNEHTSMVKFSNEAIGTKFCVIAIVVQQRYSDIWPSLMRASCQSVGHRFKLVVAFMIIN